MARVSTDVNSRSGRIPASLSSRPAVRASSDPVSDRGTSTHPVKSPLEFHSLSPWRSSTSFPMARVYRGQLPSEHERRWGGKTWRNAVVAESEVLARAAKRPEADRDDQRSHVTARPAGNRRRRWTQRLRGRGGEAAGRPRHRGGDLHPRGVPGRPAGDRAGPRRAGPARDGGTG